MACLPACLPWYTAGQYRPGLPCGRLWASLQAVRALPLAILPGALPVGLLWPLRACCPGLPVELPPCPRPWACARVCVCACPRACARGHGGI